MLTELGSQIFLDRYAEKDPQAAQNVTIGSTVLAVKDQKREVSTVIALTDTHATVRHNATEAITELVREHLDLPTELNPEDMHKRVAKAIASVEENSQFWESEFNWLLEDWKFVPAGRILASAGTPHELTSFNCFVIPSPKDSRGGIISSLGEMTEIMSRGGGVGINFSSLRPKHAVVRGVNGRSSGPVSWMELFSTATGLIEQAGSRRGALMAMMNDWHPDILEFINSKREAGHLTNCNISVAISDAFMDAVKRNKEWGLMFPDTTDPDYNTLWDGDLDKWQSAGKNIICHKVVRAREIWDAIISGAHASAEPGVFFLERANKMSNSYYYPEGQLIGTNPCGEMPLPGWGVCNLGSINLSQFYDDDGSVDYLKLCRTVELAVRFLDDVIDWTPYFHQANRNQQQKERRIGLGIMGLAELMIKCKVRYGSDEGVQFVDKLMRYIAEAAYMESARIAQEKGAFPLFNADKYLQSGFMKNMRDDLQQHIRENGARNVTLLTIPPTGTTGTMLNTSTGVEPFYALNWFRQSRLGWAEENLPILDELHAEYGDTLPDFVVTAMQLTPEEHVKMQAAAQRWVDSAISKTCNAPRDYTIEQTSDLYMLMYDLGCKGGTIYRDSSRGEQVLHLEKPETCPECEQGALVNEGGCVHCSACSYEECKI